MAKKVKQPKMASHLQPKDRTPSSKYDPESNRDEYPAWQLGLIDNDCNWSWQSISGTDWWSDIHLKLKNFETMTWQEILNATGGRGAGNGNNNHEVSLERLSTVARKRLKELGHNDIDTIFSLRLSSRERIWGILHGRVLKIIWFDQNHEVCPSIK